MVLSRPWRAATVALALAGAIVVAACASTQAGPSSNCTTSIAYNPAPHGEMMFFVAQNPTSGTASTVLKITVFDWTPTGTYELKVRGLAYTGSFFDSTEELVGECFRPFNLLVLD